MLTTVGENAFNSARKNSFIITGDDALLKILFSPYGDTYTSYDEYCEKLGHKFGVPVFNWSDDRKNCMVTFICQNDISHIEMHNATVTSEVKTEATCVSKGITSYTASYEEYKDIIDLDDIPKSNIHNWDMGVVTTETTTANQGEKTYTCTVCKTTRTEIIPQITENSNGNASNNTNTDNISTKKKSQTIKATTRKKFSAKKVKNKAQSFKLSAKSTSGSKVKCKLVKKNKNIKFAASSGKVTVKKGTKKGTYKIKVKMSVSGNNQYKAYSTTKTISIKVK